ncbi:hypothetical protein [uncultured Roseobacter sp.]|uniref:hypothetical protein n=1 Tax=uncultured Roseobacter sp. TaxID=114847 RepID=UPI0026231C2B|nr:hypothetical protein [uncultured Roseobacter sp.]
MKVGTKELITAAELHHEIVSAIAKEVGNIATAAQNEFDQNGRVSGSLPFNVVATERKVREALREIAAELERNVEALERLDKPLIGPGVSDVLDQYRSLLKADSPYEQILIMKTAADRSPEQTILADRQSALARNGKFLERIARGLTVWLAQSYSSMVSGALFTRV